MSTYSFITRFFCFLILAIFFTASLNAQSSFPEIKNDKSKIFPDIKKINLKNYDLTEINGSVYPLTIMLLASPFNPILVYEDKKVYFGFTKEVSTAFNYLSFDRIGIEYSYLFRGERRHQLRTFFEVEIPLSGSEYIFITCGVGGGYMTDFKKKGIFPQASINIIVPVTDEIYLNAYEKIRHTFMTGKNETDVTDYSIGFGFGVFF